MNFVNLRTATCHTPDVGFGTPAEYAAAARSHGQNSLAVTDRGTLTSAPSFAAACASYSLKPIFGTEILMEAVLPSGEKPAWEAAVGVPGGKPKQHWHLTVWAENIQGWRNLVKLVSDAHRASPSKQGGLVSWERLGSGTDDLLVSVGCCESGAGRAFRSGDEEGAEEIVAALAEMFPNRLAVEISPHGFGWEDALLIGMAAEATKHDLPILPTGESLYASEHDRAGWDAICCVRQQTMLIHRDVPEIDWHLPSAEGMDERLRKAGWDNADILIEDTAEWADRVAPVDIFALQTDLPLPPWVKEGSTPEDALRALAAERASQRWDDPAKAEHGAESPLDRLDRELDVICGAGYSSYFLVVEDLVRWAREQNISIGPGRGSAAGCAVAYALSITEIDPLRYGLIFERFLNPGRIQMPDIDLDLDDTRRDEAVKYLAETYGEESVGMAHTLTHFAAKNSLLDASRINGYQQQRAEVLAGMVPAPIAGRQAPLSSLSDVYPPTDDADMEKMWKEGKRLRKLEARDADTLRTAISFEGRIRNLGTHPSAVLLTNSDFASMVPSTFTEHGIAVSMFESDVCEKMGMVKLDILSSAAVRVISKVCQQIDIAPEDIPEEDTETLLRVASGDTDGMFQLESASCRRMCREVKPRKFMDIVAISALHRPGPMAQKTHLKYASALQGDLSFQDHLPDEGLAEVLASTHGLLLYQEQMMELARVYGGMSYSDADEMRRACGKKDRASMERSGLAFIAGCEANGHQRGIAESLWEWMKPFASYAFNLSHAVAYSRVSYITGYLGTHYPAVFFAEASNAERDRGRAARHLLSARKRGTQILPPSFASPAIRHTAEGDAIRFGLGMVKGAGAVSATELAKEIAEKGEFKSAAELADRVPALGKNKTAWENLAAAGAFECFGLTPAEAVEARSAPVMHTQETLLPFAPPPRDLIPSAGKKEAEFSISAKEVCGISFGDDPSSEMLGKLSHLGWVDPADFSGEENGDVRMAGTVHRWKEKTSKQGNDYIQFYLLSHDGISKTKIMKMKTADQLPPVFSEDDVVCVVGRASGDAVFAENVTAGQLEIGQTAAA